VRIKRLGIRIQGSRFEVWGQGFTEEFEAREKREVVGEVREEVLGQIEDRHQMRLLW